MNYLFLSVGRRGELMKDFRKSLNVEDRIIATDMSEFAPALYFADKKYLAPRIDSPDYFLRIFEICKIEKINAVTTFIDPEIELLAQHRKEFENLGVEVLAPYEETAKLCFDKFKMSLFLREHNIPTPLTYGSFDDCIQAIKNKEIEFPIFVKPRNGSGSVGARKIESEKGLKDAFKKDSSLIAQELMCGADLDADVYIDTISHRAVSVFTKRKLETKIGGASKTISFKDEKLFDLIQKFTGLLKFNGPIDIDFFFRDGVYYVSEVNPRFGGAYLHAYGAGVDFIKLIHNNLNGVENKPSFGNYDEGVAMLMFDSVVILRPEDRVIVPPPIPLSRKQ